MDKSIKDELKKFDCVWARVLESKKENVGAKPNVIIMPRRSQCCPKQRFLPR